MANVKPGRVLFEVSCPDGRVAREALTRALHKLPMLCTLTCKTVKREVGES